MRPPERRRGPRQGPAPEVHREDDRGASCSPIRPSPQDVAALRQNHRFRKLSQGVWRLGPRPCAEAILSIAAGRDPIEVLEELARHDPEFVRYLGARDWPPQVWRVA
jgi:hypothetical protein